jgi:large subunit ribosomal protein L22
METKAIAKHVHQSPRKVRRVLDLIRGKNTVEAMTILRFTNLRAAHTVAKVLASAMANAEHNHQVDPRTLVVTATWADGGPVLKRFQPHAQGRAFPIMKRTSHIHVVVGTK